MKKISRRKILEKWWLVPTVATLGTFGYMGLYAKKVLEKEESKEGEFVESEKIAVATVSEPVCPGLVHMEKPDAPSCLLIALECIDT